MFLKLLQRRRRGIFVENPADEFASSVGATSGYTALTELNFLGMTSYKDAVPTALKRLRPILPLGGNIVFLVNHLRILCLDILGDSRAITLKSDAKMAEHDEINRAQQEARRRFECASINGQQDCPN